MTPLLHVDHISKTYPGVIANQDISFSLYPGEIHALLGENGAGKSTLVKIIYGLVHPDCGAMFLNGQPYAPETPYKARTHGIAMVFQHFSLFEALTVAENIILGLDEKYTKRNLTRLIQDVSQQYGLPVDPYCLVGDLSAGERQRIEIIRCLLQNPQLLIMDEPTSVLTPQETEMLFHTLRQLSASGISILYISHKLDDIKTLCDRTTVLRRGKSVGICDPKTETTESMAELMIGAKLKPPKKRHMKKGAALLRLENLCLAPQNPFGVALKDINITLHAGEILGIGGIAGHGQDELLSVLSGEVLTFENNIFFKEKPIGSHSPNDRRMMGLLCAPEKRLGHAALGDMTLTENAFLTSAKRQVLTQNGMIKHKATQNLARSIIHQFDVRTNGPEDTAHSLSGGNLQKFVIGREILQRPEVFVVHQPTWGVDVAAAASIHEMLLNLAAEGAGVLVISQDLDELMQITNRLAILSAGTLSKPKSTKTFKTEDIAVLMGQTEQMHAAS